jgi:hypothetical protein
MLLAMAGQHPARSECKGGETSLCLYRGGAGRLHAFGATQAENNFFLLIVDCCTAQAICLTVRGW